MRLSLCLTSCHTHQQLLTTEARDGASGAVLPASWSAAQRAGAGNCSISNVTQHSSLVVTDLDLSDAFQQPGDLVWGCPFRQQIVNSASSSLRVLQESKCAADATSANSKSPPSAAGGSCLGPELLSQLAALGINTAQLERDHPAPAAAESATQVANLSLLYVPTRHAVIPGWIMAVFLSSQCNLYQSCCLLPPPSDLDAYTVACDVDAFVVCLWDCGVQCSVDICKVKCEANAWGISSGNVIVFGFVLTANISAWLNIACGWTATLNNDAK